jgi:riboflavin kinase/FMN adenylyltransferase
MSVSEKLIAFAQTGLEHVFVPRFDERFSSQSPADFLQSLRAADVRWMMVGDDFRFGAKRSGDVGLMRQFGAAHGIEVATMADVVTAGSGVRVSSSAIREVLAAGRLSAAAEMLGKPYAITGRVTHGKKLGRTLGFPTANVALSGRKPALAGVFAVKCRLVTRGLEGVAELGKFDVGEVLNGVANLGTNPVVSSENRPHLEVFLFDYSTDLYGKRVQVSFIEKIRDEQNFASLDGLVTQMHDDTARAKKILSRMNPDGSAKEGLQDHP